MLGVVNQFSTWICVEQDVNWFLSEPSQLSSKWNSGWFIYCFQFELLQSWILKISFIRLSWDLRINFAGKFKLCPRKINRVSISLSSICSIDAKFPPPHGLLYPTWSSSSSSTINGTSFTANGFHTQLTISSGKTEPLCLLHYILDGRSFVHGRPRKEARKDKAVQRTILAVN